MRTQKEIRADIIKAQKRVWELNDELREAEKAYKKNCPHKKTFERDQSDTYFEQGRMTGPVVSEWKEKVCKRCGKVVSKKHKRTMDIWDEEWSKP